MPLWIAGAMLGAGALGAGASIFGSSQQVSAEKKAIAAQQQMYQEGLQNLGNYMGQATDVLSPFATGGAQDYSWYNYLTGMGPSPTGSGPSYNPMTAPLTAPFNAAMLPYTPGYQFTLGQGLLGTESGYAAQGLGSSGAAMKGAAQYATGLAQSTYDQQFQNYLAQNQQIANMLLGGAALGEGAAGTLAGLYGQAGVAGLQGAIGTGQGIASSTAGIGNALAGGAAGVSGSLSNSLMMMALMNKFGQPGAASGAGSTYAQNALMSSSPLIGMGGPFQSAYPTG